MRGGEIQPWDENTYYEGLTYNRANFFSDSYLGDWWGHLDPRNFCRAVWHVSDLIRLMAWDYESEFAWKQCLDLKLDLLRYNVGDNQGIRNEVSSVLLYLNRDDDCLQFIKWWCFNYSSKYQKGMGRDENLTKLWGKGEFVYHEAGGDRFDDIFVMFNDTGDLNPSWTEDQLIALGVQYNTSQRQREVGKSLDFLMPLVIIKMRIVKHLDAQLSTTESGAMSDKEGSGVFTNMTRGAMMAKREQQYKQMQKYLHMVHKANKYILHTFGNARLMWDQGRPECYSYNTPQEAFFTMERYMRILARVPSGLDIVDEFLLKIGETKCPNLTFSRR